MNEHKGDLSSAAAALRSHIKHVISVVVHYSGLLLLWERLLHLSSGRGRFTILMYHRVLHEDRMGDAGLMPGMAVKINSFRAQLRLLRKSYRPMSLTDLVDRLEQGAKLPFRTVVITFDDGWLDNFEAAYPALREHSIPATLFVATDFVESSAPVWFDMVYQVLNRRLLSTDRVEHCIRTVWSEKPEQQQRLLHVLNQPMLAVGEIKRCRHGEVLEFAKTLHRELGDAGRTFEGRANFISWHQAREMEGILVQIGSHTCTHAILPQTDAKEIVHELSQSKAALERHLGKPVKLLAYPNGDWTDDIKREAVRSGYEAACATQRVTGQQTEDIMALPRIGIHEGATSDGGGTFSQAIFASLLAGVWG